MPDKGRNNPVIDKGIPAPLKILPLSGKALRKERITLYRLDKTGFLLKRELSVPYYSSLLLLFAIAGPMMKIQCPRRKTRIDGNCSNDDREYQLSFSQGLGTEHNRVF
jgi:hypothetical protein